MKMKALIGSILMLLISYNANAQYVFKGTIENDVWSGDAYLSIVDDYRKISGVHAEQIIGKTSIVNNYFEFKGDNLDAENRIYRIHVDSCNDDEQNAQHFNGHCENSQEIIFIANNKDTIELPISVNNQMFCSIESTNHISNAFFRIDSLKELMAYDYADFRSEASRKLNDKKWFTTFQDFGEALNEPLAELYIYNFLSDRSGDLYKYYKEDIKSVNYYKELLERLETAYPKSSYLNQYRAELSSDEYIIGTKGQSYKEGIVTFRWSYILLVLSMLMNLWLWLKLRKTKQARKQNMKDQLTKQEQKILELILQDKTNKEVASEIFVSLSTVKTHINNLYKKLGIQSRDELKRLYNN